MVTSRESSAWSSRMLDRFLPAGAIDADERRRLRMAIGLSMLALVLFPLPLIDYVVADRLREALILSVAMLGFALVPWGIRRGASSGTAAHVITGLMLVHVVLSSVDLGGIHSPAALTLLVMPAANLTLARGRAGWWWAGIYVVAIVGLAFGIETTTGLPTRETAISMASIMLGMAGAAAILEASRVRGIEALAQARRDAVTADEAKSRFLANMSHEIRTPLNGVLGMLSVLRETRLDREQTDFIETARSSGRALLQLIDEVLDFSKIEAGQVTVRPMPFQPRVLVDEVLAQCRAQADAKGLVLGAEVAVEVAAHLVGDPARIRQILVNLVGNAIKFTPEGSVRIAVLGRSSDAGPWVRFEVRDTGVGIHEQDQARVFEHFQQVDPSPSRGYEGTGLGLAIVRELVARMDGRIGLDSELHHGSIFWFELPLRESEVPAEAESFDELPSSPEDGPGAGRRVLVVEDNAVNQKVARRMLERLGAEVAVADDGAEALVALEASSFDLVMMDVQMPGMDGMETTVELRRREGTSGRRLPVVAMTAHALSRDRERCLAAGMDDYMVKPIKRRELVRVLEEQLGPRAAPRREPEEVEQAAPQDPRICDLDALRQDYGDEDEELRELAEMFVSRGRELLDLMARELEAGDDEAFGSHAHSLKGITGTMRAGVMFELLKGSRQEVASRLPRIEEAFEQVRELYVRVLGLPSS